MLALSLPITRSRSKSGKVLLQTILRGRQVGWIGCSSSACCSSHQHPSCVRSCLSSLVSLMDGLSSSRRQTCTHYLYFLCGRRTKRFCFYCLCLPFFARSAAVHTHAWHNLDNVIRPLGFVSAHAAGNPPMMLILEIGQ